MAILINVDNIHYNIFKFCGSYVFSWVVFYNYMSDSDFNFDGMDLKIIDGHKDNEF